MLQEISDFIGQIIYYISGLFVLAGVFVIFYIDMKKHHKRWKRKNKTNRETVFIVYLYKHYVEIVFRSLREWYLYQKEAKRMQPEIENYFKEKIQEDFRLGLYGTKLEKHGIGRLIEAEERRIRRHYRLAAKYNVPATLTLDEWLWLLDITDYRCVYCGGWENYVGLLDQDHVIAITRGGGYTLENIRPCCSSCNSKKNNKAIDTLSMQVTIKLNTTKYVNNSNLRKAHEALLSEINENLKRKPYDKRKN